MDFDFTQEQVMLRDLTREFLTRESSPRAVRSVMEDSQGFSDSTWPEVRQLSPLAPSLQSNVEGSNLHICGSLIRPSRTPSQP